MQTKHYVNDPEALVTSALQALTLTNPALLFDAGKRVIYRHDTLGADGQAGKVSVISGGGSGHEPGFAGMVGKGLLVGAIAGSIFASPAAEQIRTAILNHVPTTKGVLVLVMNYTGDVLNFGIAAEKARAAGVDVEFIVVADDVSIGRTKGGKVGRRGLAGSVLVAKLAGAMAELGAPLSDVHQVAKLTAENIATIGCSMDRCHVPGREVEGANDLLSAQQIEVGMGIHNEPGASRVVADLPQLVKSMLAQILDANDTDRHYIDISCTDEVVVFINNLGGVSVLELGAITTEVCSQLNHDYNLKAGRVISGTFLTSLNGLGWSVTLLKLQDTGLGPGKSMLELLDLPTEAVGWSGPAAVTASTAEVSSVCEVSRKKAELSIGDQALGKVTLSINEDRAVSVLKAGLDKAIASESEVTKFDTILGDGDCGTNLSNTAAKILAAHALPTGKTVSAVDFVRSIVDVVETTMEGTSGAIYGIFLNALVVSLRKQSENGAEGVGIDTWVRGLQESLKALLKYTTAERGDRTLMDSLIPFIDELAATHDIQAAAKASREGAEATKAMKASHGRVVYVGGEEEWMNKVPDPGAWGLAAFLDGIGDASARLKE